MDFGVSYEPWYPPPPPVTALSRLFLSYRYWRMLMLLSLALPGAQSCLSYIHTGFKTSCITATYCQLIALNFFLATTQMQIFLTNIIFLSLSFSSKSAIKVHSEILNIIPAGGGQCPRLNVSRLNRFTCACSDSPLSQLLDHLLG